MGGGKGSAPPPPDYGPIAAASSHAADLEFQLGNEQLDWAKQQYAQNSQVTNEVVNSFLNTQNVNDQNAAADRARYQNEYQPLEDQLVNEANSYSSQSRQQLEMGRAQANVATQFDSARSNATRNLEDFGVNPAATRYAAMDIGTRAQQAASEAGAGNQAYEQTVAQGLALQDEMINVGRGYPGQIAGTYNTALQAGTGAENSTLAQTASGANTMGTSTQYMGLANNSLGTWENALTQGYNNQLNAFKANQQASSGWGAVAGAGISLLGSFMEDGGVAAPPPQALPVTPRGNPGASVPITASPTGGAIPDDVPARLTPGEFVLPKDVVSWEGEKNLQKMIQKARSEKQNAAAKPRLGAMPNQAPTFNSRAPQGALPV